MNRRGETGILRGLAGSTPRLSGAQCRGRWSLFDPPGDGEGRDSATERHTTALSLCNRCPALDECRSWIQSEPKRLRMGVVGGQIYRESTRGQTDD